MSSWQHEDKDVWRKNAEFLADYEEVKPWHPSHDMGKRSEPGKGDTVRLFWLWDDLGAAPEGEDGWVWGWNVGEDYAKSVSPIIVKAKPTVSKYELACRLRRLASLVETSCIRPDSDLSIPSPPDPPF